MAKMTINMISYTLRRTVDITVVLPTATIPESMGMSGTKDSLKYQGKPKFPVLYLFHGMGNNHAQWTGYTNVELFAEERNIAVVMISAENKSYVDFNGEDFYSFIEVELQDFIKGTFPISDRPEDTYIAGLSMGGYGTLVHALRNPEKYAAAGAFSAAVELNPKSLLGPLVADDGNVDVSKLNAGVDPSIDPNISVNFSPDDMIGKALCKHKIQKMFGLDEEIEWPLLASVARLVEQKGIELVKQVLPGLMDMGCQLIVFGQGEQRYIDYFNWAKENWPGQVGFSSDYSEEVANMVFAGADMYLMPSRFEPCGLSQMMAMRYGTVPIVHETGGLKDSVRGYKEFDGIGDGFTFMDYSGKGLYLAVMQAVKLFFGDDEKFMEIRRRCMTKDFSWNKSAGSYRSMYEKILDAHGKVELSFEEAFGILKDAYLKMDETNRQAHPEIVREDYHRAFQITMTGTAEGTFYVEFSGGNISIEPYTYENADAYIECSFDNLLAMAEGKASADSLFLTDQLKISGNLARGYDIRHVLCPISETGLRVYEINKRVKEMDSKE